MASMLGCSTQRWHKKHATQSCNWQHWVTPIIADATSGELSSTLGVLVCCEGSRPVKKLPFEASSPEWSYLATQCQEIEPTNLSHKNLIRGPGWTKTQWADIRKNLHQMFLQYNHSGQHDADQDEWGSDKENRHWAWAVSWKTPGSNTVIRF